MIKAGLGDLLLCYLVLQNLRTLLMYNRATCLVMVSNYHFGIRPLVGQSKIQNPAFNLLQGQASIIENLLIKSKYLPFSTL